MALTGIDRRAPELLDSQAGVISRKSCLSIRARLLALVLVIVVPFCAMLAWYLSGVEQAGQSLALALTVLALVLVLVLVLAWRMASGIIKPVRALAGIAAGVVDGDMKARVQLDGPAELAAVAHQFNRMLDARAQTEATLRESEARWKFALEGAGDGVWDWCIRTGKTTHSLRWREILGYTQHDQESNLSDWEGRIHPDDRTRVAADLQAHFDGTTAAYLNEHRKLCKDGSYKWILNRGMVVSRDAAGKPRRMTGTTTDISERRQAEMALRESEARLSGIIDSAMDAIISVDGNQRVVLFNTAAEKMFGYTAADMIGQTLDRLIPPLSRPSHGKHIEAFGSAGMPARAMESQRSLTAIRASGEEFPIEASSISQIDIGQQKLFTVIARDVTARHQTEKRLQLADIVFNHAREGILITDAEGTILDVNATFEQITGYSREEAVGKNPRMLQSGRHGPEFYATMWRELLLQGFWAGEVWNRHKNGEIYVLMESISAVRDAAGELQNYVTLFTDITPLKAHQQQLEHVAHHDALTGLPNRALLAERLQQAMAQSRRRNQSLAVVCLDVDGFKAINDVHGRSVGDALLIDLTQRMKTVLRNGDILARTGGDEFVGVLVGLKQVQDCDLVLKRLLQALSEPVTVGNASMQVSASVGVTLYPQDGVDADLLMRHADQAMYIAKQSGKNRYHVFDVHQDVAVQTRRDEIEQIRQALSRHEFVLYYQPKVNMRTGEVVGAEALIRWQHPERGLLAPGAFLPFIEDHPISVELGEWVINTALSQMSSWHAAGLNVAVSVNIGAMQLQHSDFAPRLAELLAAHPDVEPSSLELEILETSSLEDITQVSAVMRDCQAMGVRFALDDFGTGYSSLTYLRRLPADTLKIDRSFVRDMLSDPDDLSIVESVIGLATAFRRHVVAEGVETVAHGEQLLMMGCKLAQGFGIARPMPAADMPGWVSSWQPDPVWSSYADAHLRAVQ